MKSKKQNLRVILCLPVLMLLNGCVTNTRENPNFCQIYEPVYTAHEDTEITKKEVDRNNIAFDCLCKHDDQACDKGGSSP